MRTHRNTALIAGAAGLALVLGCAGGPAVDLGAEEASVRGVLTETMEALQNQDFDAVRAHCSADWVHFNHMGGVWDLDGTEQFFREHITDHTISVSDISVQVSDDATLAWAKFNEDTEFQFDGNPVQQQALFTAILRKMDGDWKMTHLHRTIEAQEM